MVAWDLNDIQYVSKTVLQWDHNDCNGISNYQCLDCLLNCLLRHRSKKISKLCVTDLCEGNPPVTGGFPSQRASNAENISIWWRHHVSTGFCCVGLLLVEFAHIVQHYFTGTGTIIMIDENDVMRPKLPICLHHASKMNLEKLYCSQFFLYIFKFCDNRELHTLPRSFDLVTAGPNLDIGKWFPLDP